VKAASPRVRIALLFAVLSASSSAFCAEAQPVNTTQLAAWMTGGVSSSRLARLVCERGLATLPTQSELRQIESAGAGPDLMQILRSGNVQSAEIGPEIPSALLQAAADAHQQHFHEAELKLRGVLASDEQNPALHFALGVMLRQQEQWDDAFDAITQAPQVIASSSGKPNPS